MSASLYSIEQLAPVFQKNGVRKAILFGSYAKGTAQPASDVDLWVDSGPFSGCLRMYAAACNAKWI